MARPDVAALVRDVMRLDGRGHYIIQRRDLADALEAVEQERARLEEALRELLEAEEAQPPPATTEHPWDRDPEAIPRVIARRMAAREQARAALSPEAADGSA